MLAAVSQAQADGLEPLRYDPAALEAALVRAKQGDGKALAEAEARLSRAWSLYLADLRRPKAQAAMIHTDPAAVPPVPSARHALEAAARAPDLGAHLTAARRMHPIYEGLKAALAQGPEPTEARLIRANLERARALPADVRGRHIVVDAASATLWLYEDGRIVDSMPVLVGKPSQPTPVMSGLIRYAVVTPYWNVPPDLVRHQVAPKVLASGPATLTALGMEALSDWTPHARVLDPAAVDWKAIASGVRPLRVRQRPGPSNMMGEIKFMMPNNLGIYLHDTPNKSAFRSRVRTRSAGCVRLEDARRLARRLLGAEPAALATGVPEQRVELSRPVPVYITYLTAAPHRGELVFSGDVYGRDQGLMTSLQAE